MSALELKNLERSPNYAGLTKINNKYISYKRLGLPSGPPVLFVHGLGANWEHWLPLVVALNLENTHDVHLHDFEGHGLSPTAVDSEISVESLADDIFDLVKHAGISKPVILVGHSLGSHAVTAFTNAHPDLVAKIVLTGPFIQPLPEAHGLGLAEIAQTARAKGIDGVIDTMVDATMSATSQIANPLAVAAMRLSHVATDPEGYAKGLMAIVGTTTRPVDYGKAVRGRPALVITGSEDRVSPVAWCEEVVGEEREKLVVLPKTGHWHVFEDLGGVKSALIGFL